MSIYHKTIELSITIVSLASLMLNFLFPHMALANNTDKNYVLSFNISETAGFLPLISVKNSISLSRKIGVNSNDKESSEALTLSVETEIEKKKINKIIVSTLAKKVVEEEVTIASEEENDKIAERICEEAGIEKLPCWQDLRAMREKESYNGKVMTGDNGRSRGWYHIQTKMHKVSVECALDFECSTEWTVKNLITNGYKTNRVYAISRHNGGGIMARNYAKSVVYNSAKFE